LNVAATETFNPVIIHPAKSDYNEVVADVNGYQVYYENTKNNNGTGNLILSVMT